MRDFLTRLVTILKFSVSWFFWRNFWSSINKLVKIRPHMYRNVCHLKLLRYLYIVVFSDQTGLNQIRKSWRSRQTDHHCCWSCWLFHRDVQFDIIWNNHNITLIFISKSHQFVFCQYMCRNVWVYIMLVHKNIPLHCICDVSLKY